MSKNLIPQIAQMLGVEVGKKFKIKGNEGLTYRFNDDELIFSDDNNSEIYTASSVTFTALLNGKYEIVKLPWKPTLDEGYWTFTVRDFLESSSQTWTIRPGIWENHPIDIALFNKGWIYRTRAEAEAALPAVAAEMGVQYVLKKKKEHLNA